MALTVEELQIVLSCDATTAQSVLKSMEATVKAYTEKFQKYFDQIGSKKGPKNFAVDVNAIEKQLDNVTKAIDDKGKDWKKAYEKRWGETFEESMAKAKTGNHGEYIPSGKEIEWNPQGVYDPDYYNKAIAEFDAAFNHAVDASADAGEQIRSNIARWIPGGGGDSLFNLADNVTSTLQNSIGGVDSMPDTLRYKIDAVIDTVRNLGAAYREALETNGAEDKGTIALQQKFQSAVYEADRYVGKLDQIAAKEQQVEAEAASEPTRLQVAVEAVRQKVRGIGDAFRSVGQGISNVGSRIKTAFNNSLLGKFVHQLGRVMLRMAAMKLIRGVIDGAKKGLEQLAKTSKSSAKAMNTIKAAGGSIKMALGAALMPIVKALAPVFVRLAGVISSAANALARFFAVVTGQSTYTAVNFSDSLDDVADSAGGAGKAVKGALADFDELIVLGKQAGGGGGSGGTEETLSTASDLTAVSELGSRIREAIEAGDWQGVGSAFAGKLNEAINSWDPAATAQKLSNGIKNALDVAIGLLENTDWRQLGQKIATFIEEIDWNGIADKLFEAFGAAVGGLGSFLAGLFSDAWQAVKDWFNAYSFDEDGNFIISGFLKGIGDALVNIGTWIKEHIFDPFISGFKSAFGIQSNGPSTQMSESGDSVGQGILSGIAAPFKAIGTWIKEHIVNPIKNWFANNNIGTVASAGIGLIKSGWSTVADWVKTSLGPAVSKAVGVAKSGWTTISDWVNKNLGSAVSKAIGVTKNGWTTISDWVNKNLGSAVSKGIGVVRNGWTTIANWINTSWMGDAISKAIGVARSGWTTLTSWITGSYMGSALSKAIGVARSGWTTIYNWIKDSYMGDALSKAIGLVRAGWNTIRSWISANFMGDALSKGIGLIRNGWSTVAKWVTDNWLGGSAYVTVGIKEGVKSKWNSTVKWINRVFKTNLPTLAMGGIAYGPTTALVGEYAGAKANPEVIAPLSSLVNLLTKANAQTGGTSSEEEIRLMREQNAILRQLLAKKVEITPSVQLGQVIDRSQKLYART